ncbi:NADP-dependent oxidoreductase [Cellulomonas sp. ICMP 17802]|uniref:NADP-dependent oxidoreductase n=1 Tax=Cellulomonas sp. ICMP 17802 TaxID=3239199 RepID=UPI00351B28C3
MTALRAHHRGGPEQLRVERAPRPAAQDSLVLVKVHAAAITFNELLWDETWTRDGEDRTPIIPSHEWSGVVESAVASTGLRPGDAVFGMVPFDRDGAAAEYVNVPPDFVAKKPASLSHVESAALPLAGLTASQALTDHAHVAAGDRVLVLGAAGGVGSFAVQLAVRLGAQVTATAMPRDREFVQSLGPVEVVVAGDRDSHGDELATGSYDLVVDTVGGTLMEQSLRLARRGGTFVTLQQPPPHDLADALGVDGVFFVVRPTRAALDRLRESVDQGHLTVTVAATYPLAEGRAAYESGARPGRAPGKTVLVVGDV